MNSFTHYRAESPQSMATSNTSVSRRFREIINSNRRQSNSRNGRLQYGHSNDETFRSGDARILSELSASELNSSLTADSFWNNRSMSDSSILQSGENRSSSRTVPSSTAAALLSLAVPFSCQPTGLQDPLPTRAPRWKEVSRLKMAGIREDFYSTLISSYSSWVANPWESLHMSEWDREADELASLIGHDTIHAATHNAIKTWSHQLGKSCLSIPLAVHRAPFLNDDVPTCIAQSKLGYVITAYQGGRIFVKDLLHPGKVAVTTLDYAVDTFLIGSSSTSSGQRRKGRYWDSEEYYGCITHAIWTHETPESLLVPGSSVCARVGRQVEGYVGDIKGRVFKFVVSEDFSERFGLSFQILWETPEKHEDSICSMALNTNETLLAVAGTDSTVKVWQLGRDTTDTEPQLHSEIPQNSAVRALAFCPLLPNILVTGGGRHDRSVRVFDLAARSTIYRLAMPSQIVGVVWLSKLEVFVALGHSRLKRYRGFGKVINIMTGSLICEIPGAGYLLNALKTQNGFSVYTSQCELINYTWESDKKIARVSAAEAEAHYKLSFHIPQLR